MRLTSLRSLSNWALRLPLTYLISLVIVHHYVVEGGNQFPHQLPWCHVDTWRVSPRPQ